MVYTPPTFTVPPGNNIETTLAQAHSVGDGLLIVANSTLFGTPNEENPIRVSCFGSSNPIFLVTGRDGNALTIGGLLEGTTDAVLPVGTKVGIYNSFGYISDAYAGIDAAFDAINDAANSTILSGTGSPEGTVTASVGTLYSRTDGTPGSTLYVKESGDDASGWDVVKTQSIQAEIQTGSTVILDLASTEVATIILGPSTFLADPINMVSGTFKLMLLQDGMGNRVPTFGPAFYFVGNTPPTLSTAPGAIDELDCVCDGYRVLVLATTSNEQSNPGGTPYALYRGAGPYYTDSAKTQLATNDGDLIYVRPDYSGNGFDLVQATSAKRPILDLSSFNRPSVQYRSWTDASMNASGIRLSSQSFTAIYSFHPISLQMFSGVVSLVELADESSSFLMLANQDLNEDVTYVPHISVAQSHHFCTR